MTRGLLVAACALLAVAPAFTQAPPARINPPAKSARALGSPTMSPALVRSIQQLAVQRSGINSGLLDYTAGTRRLFVSSARANLAWRTREVVGEGGTYTPPPELRMDVVTVSCGDSTLGELVDCARVAVYTPKGTRVAPLQYVAGPRTYRNAMGGRWSVVEVFATYPIGPLRHGFSVRYAGTDGAEWRFEVSESDASDELLLLMPERRPLTDDEARVAEEQARAAREQAEERAAAERRGQWEAGAEERRKAEEAARLAREEAASAAAEERGRRAEAKRQADIAACEAAALRGGDVSKCAPTAAVCTAQARSSRAHPGCPHTPLAFRSMDFLPGTSATLTATCPDNQLQVTFSPSVPLRAGALHPVRLKWGNGQPVADQWSLQTSRRALTVPDARRFAVGFQEHYRVAVEFTPERGGLSVAEFNIGASPARVDMKHLIALCGATAPGTADASRDDADGPRRE